MQDWPRTGASLQNDIDNADFTREWIVEDFLPKNTVLMIPADPGTGKSCIATQIALSVSSASELFGRFKIPLARKVYYMQLEGSYAESIMRIRKMLPNVPMKSANMCWDMCDGFNALNGAQVQQLVAKMDRFQPDLVVMDPIYMCVPGGLSKDEPASSFVQFSNMIKLRYGCSNLLVHHTAKETYAQHTGKRIAKADPSYGSQWLTAHVDITYHLESTDAFQRKSTKLTCKKSRGQDVENEIALTFDIDTYTSFVNNPKTEVYTLSSIDLYSKKLKSELRATNIYEVAKAVGCSIVYLRKLKSIHLLDKYFDFVSASGTKTCWVPK